MIVLLIIYLLISIHRNICQDPRKSAVCHVHRDILSRYTPLTALCWFQEPAGIFELIEVVGNGTYGQVYKASILRILPFSLRAHAAASSRIIIIRRDAARE